MRAERSQALRVIDFVNVSGEKKICCSMHGANCDSVGLLHQKRYVSSTSFDTSAKAQWSRREIATFAVGQPERYTFGLPYRIFR